MATIKLNISTNVSKASKDMAAFSGISEKMRQNLMGVASEMSDQTVARYADKLNKLKTSYELIDDAAGGFRAQQNFLKREMFSLTNKGIDPTDSRVQFLSESFKELKATAKNAGIGLDKSGKSMKGVAASAKNAGGQVEKVKVSMSSLVGIGAGITATVAAVRGIATNFSSAYNSARDFSAEAKNVSTLSDTLGLEDIKEGIREIPKILGSSAELAAGAYQALSGGIKESGLFDFTESAAKFAKAGLTDTKTAVDVLTTTFNAFGVSSSEATEVSDKFFKTVALGKTTGEELSSSFGQVASIAAALGASYEESLAGIATLTKGGLNTTEAVTQLKAIMTAFIKPSKDMTQALRDNGYESGQMLFKAEGLAGALKFLQEETDGEAGAIAGLTPNVRGLAGVLGLMAKNEGQEFRDVLKDITAAAGDTQIALEKQQDPIDLAAASLLEAKEAFGEFLEEVVIKFAPVIEKVANYLTEIDWDAVAFGIGVVTVAFVTWKIATLLLTGSLIGMRTALLSTGIGAIVIGVGLLAVWIYKTIDANDKFKLKFLIAWEKIKSTVVNFSKTMPERLALAWRLTVQGLTIFVKEAAKILAFLLTPLDKLTEWIRETAGNVFPDSALANIKTAGELFDGLDKSLEKSIGANAEKIKAIKEEIASMAGPTERLIELQAQLEEMELQRYSTAAENTTIKKIKEDLEKLNGVVDEGTAVDTVATAAIAEKTKAIEKLSEKIRAMGDVMAEIGNVDTPLSGFVSAVSNSMVDIFATVHEYKEKLNDELAEIGEDGEDAAVNAQKAVARVAAAAENAKGKAAGIAVAALGAVKNLLGGIASAVQAFADRDVQDVDDELKARVAGINKEKEAELEKIEALGLADDEEKARKKEVEEKYDAEREAAEQAAAQKTYEIELKAFKAAKGFKIAETLAAGAAAIVQGFAMLGPIGGGIAAAITAAMTATQVAVIASQKAPAPPSFATGTLGPGYRVPPGFEGDNYPVSAKSGEVVKIEPAFGNSDVGGTPINIYYNNQRILATTIQKLLDERRIVIK